MTDERLQVLSLDEERALANLAMAEEERLNKLAMGIIESHAEKPLPSVIAGLEEMERVERFVWTMRKVDLLGSQEELIERWGQESNIDIRAARQEIEEKGLSLGGDRPK